MTNETRERIKYYKEKLPHMKEKVAAALMMLVIAASVSVTATYAWITLSTAPEVVSIETTVAANGSLEIALVNEDGRVPGKSAAGDSTGAGNELKSANITWGNLINLSDPSYGLSKITLRPAALNEGYNLLTSPLFGVGYGEDGRITNTISNSDFDHAYYSEGESKFLVDTEDNHLGVRAISTVKYENLEGDTTFRDLLDLASQKLTLAKNNYAFMTRRDQETGARYIASLEGLIEAYAQNVLDKLPESQLIVTEHVSDLYDMMVDFRENVMYPLGESYVQMANMLKLIDDGVSSDAGYDVEKLIAASKKGALPGYIKDNLDGLTSFANDYETINLYLKKADGNDYSEWSDKDKKNSLAYWAYRAEQGGTDVYWSDISTQINWICSIKKATLDEKTLAELANPTTAAGIFMSGSNKIHQAKIKDGAIWRMEKRIGQKMSTEITVEVDPKSVMEGLPKTKLRAQLSTNVTAPYDAQSDISSVESMNDGYFKGGTPTAEDTYAMTLDFWIRTNAGADRNTEPESETLDDGTVVITSPEKAYLTLEGAVKTVKQEVQATITDINGDEQPAYIASATVEGQLYEMEVFERYGVYYYIDSTTGNEVDLEADLKSQYGKLPVIEYRKKVKEEDVVIGYEGVNRVWNEEQMTAFNEFDGTSTTQGGGSCYVFYAASHADQARFLELLDSMKIVFVDEDGQQLGVALMDTKNCFGETGKFTVPLVLDKTQAISLGEDENGNVLYGITVLEKNVAKRITAIVYLDGVSLTNEMVLASGDIQGALNLQFGSSVALTRTTLVTEQDGTITEKTEHVTGNDNLAAEDKTVMNQYVKISAGVESQKFKYDPVKPAQTMLTVSVEGINPTSVSARFMRAISSTQGVQMDSISLNKNSADGAETTSENWSTRCIFNKPGKYVLRSVWIDGAEYSLNNPIEVEVTGSTVQEVTCEAITDGSNRATIMTAENSYSTKMTLDFTSNENITNSKVSAVFMDENERPVNVKFVWSGEEWRGTAKFTTSGSYELMYVEIDGEGQEVGENQKITLDVMLGLKARTWIKVTEATLGELIKDFEEAVATNFVIKEKIVPLVVEVELYDNSGNPVKGLSGAKLYYGRVGSSALEKGLDSDLTWDASIGRYTGTFSVKNAGTYTFAQVQVGTNTILSYTIAPNIQAMPPDDAEYDGNYTESYQYAPDFDAAMVLGIKYSSAATGVKAKITDGTTTFTVDGNPGTEVDDVTPWSFKIPINSSGSQEGEWKLTDITMFGVYYDGTYYGENGKTINLERLDDIHTKVVNYIYVGVDVPKGDATNGRILSGNFMELQNVDGITVSIEDFEGEAIEGQEIDNVKLYYELNKNSVTLNNYGYASENLPDKVRVEGIGTLVDDSTQYNISTMKFSYVGKYEKCMVEFDLNGETVVTGADNIKVTYMEEGRVYIESGSDRNVAPPYEVCWETPDVEIIEIAPTKNVTITSEGDTQVSDNPTGVSMQTEVKSWLGSNDECSFAVIHIEYEPNASGADKFNAPSVTMKLSDVGSEFNKVELSVPDGEKSGSPRIYTFKPGSGNKKDTVTNEIGEATTAYLGFVPQHHDCGLKTISNVTITGKDGTVWNAKLSRKVIINEQGHAAELKFADLSAYGTTAPQAIKTSSSGVTLSQDGSGSMTVTLPEAQAWTHKRTEVESIGSGSEEEENTVVYIERTVGSGCDKETVYDSYNRNIKTTTAKAIEKEFTMHYKIDAWKINGKMYDCGTEGVTITGNWTATVDLKPWKEEPSGENEVTTITTVTLDTPMQSGLSKAPSGGKKIKAEELHTTAFENMDVIK